MTEAYLAHLIDRAVLAVTGPDAVKFLHGIVTNDVAHLNQGEAAHAGLLSPQGKILFDFIAVRTNDGFLLDAPADKAADLIKRLSMYKLRAAVTLSDVSQQYATFVQWGGEAAACCNGAISFGDPRHADLGRRIFTQRLQDGDSASKLPADAYHAHRIALGVPEGGKDYEFGDAYPHEADFDLFHGVSFKKGCYVGQEVVSRMQHKTVVRKRVVRVVGDAGLASDCDVTCNGVTIGRTGSVAGHHGLALLKLDRYADAMTAHAPVLAGATRLTVNEVDLARYLASVQAHEKT